MAKKKVLKLEFDQPATVIGIASNDKVWKLCWKLNQALSLAMATADEGVTKAKGPVMYNDLDTDPAFDYLLFESASLADKASKLAKQFRFWLVIRHKRSEVPDTENLLSQVATIDIVSLARDLSGEKDIKRLLP